MPYTMRVLGQNLKITLLLVLTNLHKLVKATDYTSLSPKFLIFSMESYILAYAHI